MKRISLLLLALIASASPCFCNAQTPQAPLDKDEFRAPPAQFRPHVWWHWVGYNVEKEGITKDLESMKNAGIAGATLFQLVSTATDRYPPVANTYSKGIDYLNDKWWDLIQYSAKEARRLGLELGLHNCIGWSVSGGPWIKPANAMQQVVWSETKVAGPRYYTAYIDQPETKLNYYKDIAVLLVPDGEPAPTDIIDVSEHMRPDGRLSCEIPKGNYTIYRFGHTPTGAKPTSAPENVNALEADKMNAATMMFHMENVLAPLKRHAGEYLGGTITYMLFDSYEAGDQNWTPLMRREFRSRKGYDIVPWLPVLAGRTLASKDSTEAFRRDLKTAVSDMFIEYSYGIPKKMLHELGMKIQIEPYATGPVNVPRPFDTFDTAHVADLPTTEFWTRMRREDIDKWHVNAAIPFFGKNLLSAEAFTGGGAYSRWAETPSQLKFSGDIAYSKGVNRMILHHWVHQPFPDNIKPGMCMGPWGTHFGRNQTWYEPGKAWIAYLGRSQYLLQKGEKVSDFISLNEYMPGGDVISENTLLKYVDVKNGKLTSPAGRIYHLLAMPDARALSLAALEKLQSLVARGAVIFGPRPAYAKGGAAAAGQEEKFQAIAGRLWGKTESSAPGENTHGEGRVMWGGGGAQDALRRLNIPPSIVFPGGDEPAVCRLHRRAGDSDIFYFSNLEPRDKYIKVSLRSTGKTPEIWDPETGEITPVATWRPSEIGTDVSLRLKANQALFIVCQTPVAQKDFIKSAAAEFDIECDSEKNWIAVSRNPGAYHMETVNGRKLRAVIETVPADMVIDGAWDVQFTPPLGNAFTARLERLESWTRSEDARIKYFSGTAVYTNTFRLPAQSAAKNLSVMLNLGAVKDIAWVTVNGRRVATLWHAPFEVDISKYIKPGGNTLSISVTNTWANRLIGDNSHPDDCEWSKDMGGEGRALARFPSWLIERKPRPSAQREAFSTWNYFNEKSQLLEAGLSGDVKLEFRGRAVFE